MKRWQLGNLRVNQWGPPGPPKKKVQWWVRAPGSPLFEVDPIPWKSNSFWMMVNPYGIQKSCLANITGLNNGGQGLPGYRKSRTFSKKTQIPETLEVLGQYVCWLVYKSPFGKIQGSSSPFQGSSSPFRVHHPPFFALLANDLQGEKRPILPPCVVQRFLLGKIHVPLNHDNDDGRIMVHSLKGTVQ